MELWTSPAVSQLLFFTGQLSGAVTDFAFHFADTSVTSVKCKQMVSSTSALGYLSKASISVVFRSVIFNAVIFRFRETPGRFSLSEQTLTPGSICHSVAFILFRLASFSFLQLLLTALSVAGASGAYPCCHRTEAGSHPGQVARLSQGRIGRQTNNLHYDQSSQHACL